jgi:uncharacterized RDD family membrane protein YckC
MSYASWLQRVAGYLVDVCVLLPAVLVVAAGAAVTGSGNPGDTAGFGVGLLVIGWLGLAATAVWNLLLRQGRTGWSVGKQLVGIRLLHGVTGAPPGPGVALLRQVAHLLDTLPCYLGWLWPLWDRRAQTFADKMTGTVVVVQRRY